MPPDSLLGAFEELVLLAIVHLGPDAYGMRVRRELEARTGRAVNIGAVYSTLNRLESKDYVQSEDSRGSQGRGGRLRRTFRLRPAGAGALREARHAAGAMWDGIDPAALPGPERA